MYSILEIRKKLLSILDGVSGELWNTKTEASDWTISQVVRHLGETDQIFLKILQNEVENESVPVNKRDISFIGDRSIKMKTPIEPPNEFISKDVALTFLQEMREKTLTFLDKYPLSFLETKSANIGRLGILNLDQVIEFIALHEKRHIEQIEEIMEALKINEN
jgi:uncharacterized damage-inducible protein DinB